MTQDGSSPGGETTAAHDNSAADFKSTSTPAELPDGAWWTMKDVLRLHQDLDLHVFPMRENKIPMDQWRHGGTDYTEVKPTDDEIAEWASKWPAGWCILCGGPARILVLDIEAAGMADLSEKGERIRHVLDRLPDTCKRPSPSGGEHAVLHISDGPAPDGHGHLLVERHDGIDEKGNPRMTLLAEYRGHGSYAVVLGQGRGPLQPDFALHDVTLAELQAILDYLREVSDNPAAKHLSSTDAATKVSDTGVAKTPPEAMPRLQAGPMCDAVSKQLDKICKSLANGPRNEAVKGPLVQLVRLGKQGHHGVPEAVALIREDFIDRVTPDRPGGGIEANQEWSRLLQGAVRIVFPTGITSGPDAPCVCLLPSLRLALQQDRFFSANGRAKVTERKVLAHLLDRAKNRHSLRLKVAQRPIAEAIDITQHTVSKTLTRLEKNGWLTREHQGLYGGPDFITLALPTCAVSTSTKASPTEEVLVDVDTNAWVHRLFGPMGLGPGVAGTFRALPEWQRRTRNGRLVRVMPGTVAQRIPASELLLNPQQGKRRIPPALAGPGLTVSELARRTGKARGTVAVHVKKLSGRGLAFRDDKGRWWRYRFDPDRVADRDQIPETAKLKEDRHIRDRRSFFRGQIRSDQMRNRTPSVQLVHGPDVDTYVNPRTGEVLWIDTDPPETDPDGTSGLS
jgi:DNA-binding MarR family transcriptional regulator